MPIRVVVTGGRDFADEQFVVDWLDRIQSMHNGIVRLAHGGATGADALARKWGEETTGCEVIEYRAEWRKYGPAAGPIRNRVMLTSEEPDFVLVFPGGKGTENCAKQAKELSRAVIDLRPVYDPSLMPRPIMDSMADRIAARIATARPEGRG